MIVFDLEWTRPFEQESMEEIIQIGAVKIDKLGGPITDSFTVYIRPSVYQELSPIAKRLPDVTLSTGSEIVFPDAYQAFVDWCADDTVFASWGGQDIGVLAKNAKHWELPTFTVTESYNLQAAFAARWMQTGRSHWKPQSHIVSSQRCFPSTMRFVMPCMRHWSPAGSILLRCRRRRSTRSHKSARRSSAHWNIPRSRDIRSVYSPRGKR